jgi:hypothetical protein
MQLLGSELPLPPALLDDPPPQAASAVMVAPSASHPVALISGISAAAGSACQILGAAGDQQTRSRPMGGGHHGVDSTTLAASPLIEKRHSRAQRTMRRLPRYCS